MSLHPERPARVWQRMLSGRRLDLVDPSPLDIEIADIAHGLARVARWNGQTHGEHAFSVAQHGLLVEALVQRLRPQASGTVLMLALLHDAPEYVIGDMISPFKAVLGQAYRQVEHRLQVAVHRRFGLPAEPAATQRRLIKQADIISAYLEAIWLAGFAEAEAADLFGRPQGVDCSEPALLALVTPWPVAEAEARFLARFHVLDEGRARS